MSYEENGIRGCREMRFRDDVQCYFTKSACHGRFPAVCVAAEEILLPAWAAASGFRHREAELFEEPRILYLKCLPVEVGERTLSAEAERDF
jgi:hypothetical protein